MTTSEVTLLLVGNTGNGKSATGNSILGHKAFKTTASTSSLVNEYVTASSSFRDVKIKVLDGPGIDTNRSAEEVLHLTIETIKEALALCIYRFSALLIVLKYGARFTKQEADFIKIIKGILGKNVIRDFGVCVLTHGDNFEYDYVDENVSFKDWCQQQEGEIKNLFNECNNRCVLFDNRTKDEKLKEAQVSKLMEMLPKDVQYSENAFNAADSDLQKLIIETKMPNILKDTNVFIDGKRNTVATIQSFLDVSKQIQSYKDVLNQVNEFEKTLIDRYNGPDNIRHPLDILNLFKRDVELKFKTAERNQQQQQEIARAESWSRSRQHQYSQVTPGDQSRDDINYHTESRDDKEKSNKRGENLINRTPPNQNYGIICRICMMPFSLFRWVLIKLRNLIHSLF